MTSAVDLADTGQEHMGLRVVTRRFVRSAARAGDPVWCYVVNEADEAERLRALGVAGCFSTRPVGLSQALCEKGQKTSATR